MQSHVLVECMSMMAYLAYSVLLEDISYWMTCFT